MRTRTPLAVAGVVCFCLASAASAQTNVGGLIASNRTWTTAGSPYIVTSSVVIGNNATLTIQPGVEVRFNNGLGITVGSTAFGAATLKAQGTAGSKIVFRSNTFPQNPGAWGRIHFTDFAIDANFDGSGNYLAGSIIEHAIVEYAGSGDVGAVTIESSRAYISYVEMRHNRRYGIVVTGSSAPPQRINSCEIWDCQGIGALILNGGSGHLLKNNNIHNNIGGSYTVYINAPTTLDDNIVSNNTNDYYGIVFDSSSSGSTLLSNTISGNSGQGILFSGSVGSTLTGNTVSGNSSTGVTFQYSGSATLSANTISANGGVGLYFFGSGTNLLTSNTITGNNGGGIPFISSGGNTLTSNTITGNNGGGIRFSSSGRNTLTSNTITGNNSGGIYLSDSGYSTLTSNTITGNGGMGA